MKTSLALSLAGVLAGANLAAVAADNITVSVQADQPGARINPAMWGVFFEDINLGADGGLYAELIKIGPLNSPTP